MADLVDLQRRQEEESRRRQRSGSSRRSAATNPVLLLGTGFVLGSTVAPALYEVLGPTAIPAFSLLTATIALACYFAWLLRRGPAKGGPKVGCEKQLLLALRKLGSLTRVEAALETSLTVGEASDILTRFAERGHLAVQSRDGVLVYALPGNRSAPETRTV